jgi:hypothetical protein
VAYATISDVLEAAPQIKLSGTSKPTISEAEAHLNLVSQYIDGILKGLGYDTPVTGEKSLMILKDIAISGTIAKILKSMYWGVRNPEDVGANDAWKEFQHKLRALADPDHGLTLEDAPITQQGSKVMMEIGNDPLALLEGTGNENFRPTRDQVF